MMQALWADPGEAILPSFVLASLFDAPRGGLTTSPLLLPSDAQSFAVPFTPSTETSSRPWASRRTAPFRGRPQSKGECQGQVA